MRAPQMFQCPNGLCIMKCYVCDGHPDCKNGVDESAEECYPNPCEGRLHCEDRCCIPISWCCDSYHEPNCTSKVLLKCCGQLSTNCCAMTFIFIVTILVIAICRVHMKHSLLSQCPAAVGPVLVGRHHHHHHHGLQHIPLYDLDVLLNRSPYASSTSQQNSGMSAGYDVQLVGRPVDPPPYCEVVPSSPREDPPPPYASYEATPSPTLTTAATNEASEGDSLLGSTEDNWVDPVCVCSLEQSCQSIVEHEVVALSSSDLQLMADLVSEGADPKQQEVATLPKVIREEYSSVNKGRLSGLPQKMTRFVMH